jgi:hypothetical protein
MDPGSKTLKNNVDLTGISRTDGDDYTLMATLDWQHFNKAQFNRRAPINILANVDFYYDNKKTNQN